MKKQTGLWIDHRRAIIVILSEKGEEIRHLTSELSSEPDESRVSAGYDRLAEDRHDRRVSEHRNRYYDDIIAAIPDGDMILIIGPGEAKQELRKRLELHTNGARSISTETADHMTDRQIAAHVRNYYHAHVTNR